MNFATLKGLTIPEGKVKQVTDEAGNVLWSAAPSVVTVTITADGDGSYAFLDIGGSEYYEEQTVELPVGTVILCCIYRSGQVFLNGNLYANGSGEWEYTVTKNCAIHLTDYSSAGRIDITEQ